MKLPQLVVISVHSLLLLFFAAGDEIPPLSLRKKAVDSNDDMILATAISLSVLAVGVKILYVLYILYVMYVLMVQYS